MTEVWATDAAVRAEDWIPRDAQVVNADALRDVCGSDDHQGVCAEAGDYLYADPDRLLAAEDALVLALDQVQDPHNLGAVARVAESAGAAGIVIPERRAAEVTPAVCKASAGAVEHLPIARVRNLADWLAEAKRAGAWVYGADADGTPYDQLDWNGRTVLVLGAEGAGLRPRVAARAMRSPRCPSAAGSAPSTSRRRPPRSSTAGGGGSCTPSAHA